MDINQAALIVIDVQGRLATSVYDYERLFGNIERVVTIANIFKMPILWSEQAPEKIGATIEPIARFLSPLTKPISKRTFSCYGSSQLRQVIDESGRRQIVLVGIETHVCIYQTARDLHRHGYEVYVVEDAVSSRTQANKAIAIERMRHEGIVITSAEMMAAELLGGGDHPQFKEVMAHIKRQ
jgi:nicotinamidase-related amidase